MRGTRIEFEALIVGYAMSRLDRRYLAARGQMTWDAVFEESSNALGLPPASFKNLRDEFDPYFDNSRKGWWKRDIRSDRQRMLVEFESVSEGALLELVSRVLGGDHEAAEPVIEVIEKAPIRVANVAERLLTGRLAEDYFVNHHEVILGIPGATLEDLRIAARGYDFGILGMPHLAVEVKGLKRSTGGLLFTDREWTEATTRQDDYWVVIVGDLETTPRHAVVPNPVRELKARCAYQTSVSVTWQANYSLIR